MIDLRTLGGEYSSAWGINDSGHVAGGSETTDGSLHPFRSTPAGGMIDGTYHAFRYSEDVPGIQGIVDAVGSTQR